MSDYWTDEGDRAKYERKMENMVCRRKRERQRKRDREVGERVPALARKMGGGREKKEDQ